MSQREKIVVNPIYTLIISRAEWRANEKGIMQLNHSSGYRWIGARWNGTENWIFSAAFERVGGDERHGDGKYLISHQNYIINVRARLRYDKA